MRINVGPGETVAIGTALAELEVEGAAEAPAEPAEPKSAEPEADAPKPAAPSAATPRPPSADGEKISPAVRRLLEDNGLKLSQITGSGGRGRVRREDVIAYLAEHRTPGPAKAPPVAASSDPRDELVRISAVRRQIAEHMVRSVSTLRTRGRCGRST